MKFDLTGFTFLLMFISAYMWLTDGDPSMLDVWRADVIGQCIIDE